MLDTNDRTIAERSPAPGIAQPRDLTADVIRGIAIILVVFGHANRGMIEAAGQAAPPALRQIDFVIYTTHMPAFFLLAGYFAGLALARHRRRDYAASRGWAVIYPYLLWSLIFWTIKVFGIGYVHHGLGLGDAARILFDPISIYWFLYALLLLQLAAAASYPHVRLLLALAIALALARAVSPGSGIIALTLMHAPYFTGGLALAGTRWTWTQPRLARTPMLAGLALLFAAGCAMALAMGAHDPVSPLTT
ncbi:MAG: acyltransferase family protein, partial [Sphingomonas sp.]